MVANRTVLTSTQTPLFEVNLKGICTRFLTSGIFHKSISPGPPSTHGSHFNFYENSRRYLKAKVNHRCQRLQRQKKTIFKIESFFFVFFEMLLGLRISPRIFLKIQNGLYMILIHERNLKWKISCQTPFKDKTMRHLFYEVPATMNLGDPIMWNPIAVFLLFSSGVAWILISMIIYMYVHFYLLLLRVLQLP
jgi:hypothetical protein